MSHEVRSIVVTRTYRIEQRRRGHGGPFFVCLECGHRIDVATFPALIPLTLLRLSPRTQAAAAMKAHARRAHNEFGPKPIASFC